MPTSLRLNSRAYLLLAGSIILLFIATISNYVWSPPSATAATTELFFSEYIEGSSNNKALEIYNDTGAPINLATGGYNFQVFSNGAGTPNSTTNLTGIVANGDVYVIANPSSTPTILAQADQTSGNVSYNGNDAVVLRKGTLVIDSIGRVGQDPGTEWGTGLTSTADNTLRRKATVCAGDTITNDTFDPSVEWDGFATDTFNGLGTVYSLMWRRHTNSNTHSNSYSHSDSNANGNSNSNSNAYSGSFAFPGGN